MKVTKPLSDGSLETFSVKFAGSTGGRIVTATPPTTKATVVPTPNSAGWNNTNATVQLAATPAGAAQVQNISYSLSGAQTGSGTPVWQ